MIPLIVYRIYPDGRPDELIRGVDIVGTPLASFGKIMATSDKSEIFNGILRGRIRATCPCPPFHRRCWSSEIEIQRKERSQDRPPYLSRPPSEIKLAGMKK